MLISIITPTFNSSKSIKGTVESIISQTNKNFEHVIIDNQSSDNTLEIIIKIYKDAGIESKLKIISEKDKGISDAFNKGITFSTGQIIGILNSDDLFYDNSILSLVNTSLSNPDKLLSHGNILFMDELFGSNIRFPLNNDIIGIEFNHPGMFVKREVYSKVGLYNEEMHFAMDVDFFFRLKKKYDNIDGISSYINYPLVIMKAGGASWKNEIRALKEVKTSLVINDMWNFNSATQYLLRIFRTRIKSILSVIGLQGIVKIWRNIKWGSKSIK
jgi:glycosyltransferase involved in cell wall biosynthesis